MPRPPACNAGQHDDLAEGRPVRGGVDDGQAVDADRRGGGEQRLPNVVGGCPSAVAAGSEQQRRSRRATPRANPTTMNRAGWGPTRRINQRPITTNPLRLVGSRPAPARRQRRAHLAHDLAAAVDRHPGVGREAPAPRRRGGRARRPARACAPAPHRRRSSARRAGRRAARRRRHPRRRPWRSARARTRIRAVTSRAVPPTSSGWRAHRARPPGAPVCLARRSPTCGKRAARPSTETATRGAPHPSTAMALRSPRRSGRRSASRTATCTGWGGSR